MIPSQKFKERYAEWVSGSTKSIRVSGSTNANRWLKKAVMYRDGYECSICHIDSWLGVLLSLELDHIDGDRKNNVSENVRLLCPNCHSQTETFKGRNK
jgi:5-methylcytosine-specific restriction endonuclease McrA